MTYHVTIVSAPKTAWYKSLIAKKGEDPVSLNVEECAHMINADCFQLVHNPTLLIRKCDCQISHIWGDIMKSDK